VALSVLYTRAARLRLHCRGENDALFNETLFRNMCGYKGHWGTLTQGLGFFLITSSFYLTLYTSNERARELERVGERERRSA
jgi:hypothetical protein